MLAGIIIFDSDRNLDGLKGGGATVRWDPLQGEDWALISSDGDKNKGRRLAGRSLLRKGRCSSLSGYLKRFFTTSRREGKGQEGNSYSCFKGVKWDLVRQSNY